MKASLILLHLALASAAIAQEPVRLHPGPTLLLDERLIAARTRIHRHINTPARLPYPVVTGPQDKCFQPYVTVLRDPQTRLFRIWYGVPESESQSHIGYMESLDGIVWKRPHRVLPDPSRIQFGVSVIDEGPDFPQPDWRYKYGWWYGGGLRIAASADGLNFKPIKDGVVLEHNHDINCIFRDPIRNRYMAMVSTYTTGEKWKGQRRIPMESVSDDLLEWKKPWVVISPDEKDEGETQFYCMGGLIARGGTLIGMLRVLRDDLPAEPGGPVQGIGYTVLAWSHDGQTWQRDRESFLPRNPQPGTWDRAMTWADCQLVVGDETYIYYGGYARGHKVERFTERQIGLARMPLDRYVGWVAGPWDAQLRTIPLLTAGGELTVNARIEDELRVRVLDEKGQPLPGFDYTEAQPVKGDSLRHPVHWKGGKKLPAGEPIALEFAIRSGELYAFEIK